MTRSHPLVAGFALLATVLALLVIGAVTTAGYLVSVQAYRMGRGTLEANGALYAAESGLAASLTNWADVWVADLAPGGETVLPVRTLGGGDAYEVRIERTDDGRSAALQSYLIHSYGRARGIPGSARHVSLAVKVHWPVRVCCSAAATVLHRATIEGVSALVLPDASEPSCGLFATVAALSVGSGAHVELLPGEAAIEGDPSIRVDPSLADVAPWADLGGGLSYEDLAAQATVELAGGSSLGEIGPRRADGDRCAAGDPRNWGAPLEPGHACATHFPIVHALGDLRVSGPGSGQGVLLVDGDLTMDEGFEFFGPVLVRGAARLSGEGTRLRGALVAGELWVAGAGGGVGTLRYDPCAVRRGLVGSGVVRARPLAGLPWMELFR